MPLYKMTSPSGKSYIGITTGRLINRMHRHRAATNAGSQYSIHNAIRKYGFKAFTVEVLDEETDIEKLNKLEVVAIAEHGTLYPAGYNLTIGGDGVAGPHSAERTRRMWETMSEEKRAEVVEKMTTASRSFWSGVGDEELLAMRLRGADAARNWWKNATPEQLDRRNQRAKEKADNRADEERKRIADVCRAAASSHWANQTEEERVAHAVVRATASKNTWANLTSEQRAERGRRMSEGRTAAKAKKATQCSQ